LLRAAVADKRRAASHRGPYRRQRELAPAEPQARKYAWAELMKHVFDVDVLASSARGGGLRIVASIHPRGRRSAPPACGFEEDK